AYLSVMLYLLNNTNPIPSQVEELTQEELSKIEEGKLTESAIFGYVEDFSQYKVRGHYTRNAILANYFKAMMYAGRMSFLLQSPSGDISMGMEQTRMALALICSFNASIGSETIWDYWDRIYEPTSFYVGSSDDLTAEEYYEIWKDQGSPYGDELADDSTILAFISEAKNYRRPQINSMFIYDIFDYENVTQGFRLMGQRFIPDSYIFQQLVDPKIENRLMPSSLDVFSVFGSPRAATFLQQENETHLNYSTQINMLREQFNNLTEYDWTQNLYWLWLYTLFPLLDSAKEGFPGFMLNNAWTDKALMTALGSWAELRHDTILYAKQSATPKYAGPTFQPKGFVEPYPEVYSRLASLVRLMINGLEKRSLLNTDFTDKLVELAEIYDKLAELSVKELENKRLTDDDYAFINSVGLIIAELASFNDPSAEPWVSETDDRMAIIADVHTDFNTEQVLEVSTGNPYTIYVIVQNQNGALRLTKGGTFSYYEFKQPLTERLSDEEWHTILDTAPPELPAWMTTSLPIIKITQNKHLILKEQN
ncbi:MAG: DUF3160 domain-containing protein, partial [Candidatus Heimdallarchaeaceae archaeon]